MNTRLGSIFCLLTFVLPAIGSSGLLQHCMAADPSDHSAITSEVGHAVQHEKTPGHFPTQTHRFPSNAESYFHASTGGQHCVDEPLTDCALVPDLFPPEYSSNCFEQPQAPLVAVLPAADLNLPESANRFSRMNRPIFPTEILSLRTVILLL